MGCEATRWNLAAAGEHNIPEDVIERRYKKGLVNLFDIYMDLVDAALIFDNSFGNHELIAEKFETENISILNDEKFNALKQYNEQAR